MCLPKLAELHSTVQSVDVTVHKLSYLNKKWEKIPMQEKNCPYLNVSDLVIQVRKDFEREEMEQEIGKQRDRMKSDSFFPEGGMCLFHKLLWGPHDVPGSGHGRCTCKQNKSPHGA